MERAVILDKENSVAAGNTMKAEKVAKGSILGNLQRKTLSDISNLPQRNQDAKLPSVSQNTKEYIDKLHQENMVLVKLVADRNKIIELSAIELQKLRVSYQKVQQQNLQLAQANTQMLAELNSGKDRLKQLQHELGCKNGLLKAQVLESKEKADKIRCQVDENEVKVAKSEDGGEFSQVDNSDKKPHNNKRKRQSKAESSDPCSVKPVQAKDNVQDKRLCTRRQSTMLQFEEEEPLEKMPEIGDAVGSTIVKSALTEKTVDKKRLSLRRQAASLSQEQLQVLTEASQLPVSPQHNDQLQGDCSKASVSSMKDEPKKLDNASSYGVQELRRSSFRPVRHAAAKIQSYKEIPLNVKMRRPE